MTPLESRYLPSPLENAQLYYYMFGFLSLNYLHILGLPLYPWITAVSVDNIEPAGTRISAFYFMDAHFSTLNV